MKEKLFKILYLGHLNLFGISDFVPRFAGFGFVLEFSRPGRVQ